MSRASQPIRPPADVYEPYDSLGENEQAIVREKWGERMTALRNALNYEAEFVAAGESYSESDEDGTLVIHPPRR